MKIRRPIHRRGKAKRRLALVTAATAAAAGLAVGVVTIGSASPGDRPSAANQPTPGVEPLYETPPEPLSDVPESNERRGMVYRMRPSE